MSAVAAMDREPDELQFLGVFGIYGEAYKILHSWRRILSQIAVSLILPLSLIFLAHIQISDLLFSRIASNKEALGETLSGTASEDRLLRRLPSEWTTYIAFKAAYLVTFLVLSLLSTAAVIYTIACVYTGKEASYNRVMTVIPKVWKRLMITFL